MCHGIDEAQVEEVAAAWHAAGWTAVSSSTDLSEHDAATQLYEQVRAELGAPDILVINASIELPQPLAELTVDAMAAQTAVNLVASAELLRACVPAMQQRGWGRVIAIGSVQEDRPNARHFYYAATKAALTNMVLNLARNQRAAGVTFNVIRPGAIVTDRNRAALADPAFEAAVIDRIPLGRLGMANDCAGIASLLCSDAGDYINGAVVPVDGGMRL